ncbi:MAG: ABC transporter permease [Treponemataceae bacterium]
MKENISKFINRKPYIFALMGFLCMFVIISIAAPRFFDLQNFTSITRQISINAILAVGMTFVILTGGIDLSVGSVAALSATSMALLMKNDIPFILVIFLGIALGAVIGFINGFFITKAKLPPIIVTLSMMEIARGCALLLTGGYPVSNFDTSAISILGKGEMPFYITIFVFLVAWIFLSFTRSGRYIFAIGGNKEAVRLSGIDSATYELLAYVLSGVTAAIAGIILLARTSSGQPNAGVGFELDAIAAVVLGGTSITGGFGHIFGTLIGAGTLGIINNGLNLLNINPFTQRVVKGIIIISAVLVGLKKKKK